MSEEDTNWKHDWRTSADEVALRLAAQPDRGIPHAVEAFFQAGDPDEAQPMGIYLGVLPDLVDEKRKLVEFALRERRELLDAAALLVRSVPEQVVDAVLEAYVEDPDAEPTYAIAFEATQFFPHRARGYRARITDEDLREAMLPGSDDQFVDELEASYRDDPDPKILRSLGRIRTKRALGALLALKSVALPHEHSLIDLLLEHSGVFPQSGRSSVHKPAFRGFVVPRDEASHEMGAGFPERVPKCPICETPATRVLTLEMAELPYALSPSPSFFWFSCSCEPLDYIYVKFAARATEGLMVEMTLDEPDEPIVPGEPSLQLEAHPNQHGYGLEIPPGWAFHQVGGIIPWIDVDQNPRCPECGEGMPFLAAVDSGLTPLGLMRFSGTLYGFWCDDCKISCTTRQTDLLE